MAPAKKNEDDQKPVDPNANKPLEGEGQEKPSLDIEGTKALLNDVSGDTIDPKVALAGQRLELPEIEVKEPEANARYTKAVESLAEAESQVTAARVEVAAATQAVNAESQKNGGANPGSPELQSLSQYEGLSSQQIDALSDPTARAVAQGAYAAANTQLTPAKQAQEILRGMGIVAPAGDAIAVLAKYAKS